jgi:hypothetical protein
VSQGGQAHLANLRILCAAHNRYVYPIANLRFG